jgi:hypothetical protein
MMDSPRPSIDSADFSRWCRRTLDEHAENPDAFAFNDPKKNFVMEGILPPHIRELLGTESDTLILSRRTYFDHLKHGLAPDEYAKVLNNIEGCTEIYQGKDSNIALIIEYPKPHVAILKPTQDRSEAYIVTLHRLREHSLKRFRSLQRIF